mgnify:FL=1
MENKRPTLNDPEEFALIKSIYFKENKPAWKDLDPIERNERMESRIRNKNKSVR